MIWWEDRLIFGDKLRFIETLWSRSVTSFAFRVKHDLVIGMKMDSQHYCDEDIIPDQLNGISVWEYLKEDERREKAHVQLRNNIMREFRNCGNWSNGCLNY